MSEKHAPYTHEFKIAALKRMETCRNVSALARELGIRRKFLYAWRETMSQKGEAALKPSRGRPRGPSTKTTNENSPPQPETGLEKRVAELERLLGAKQLEVDFFKRTFEHVRGAMQNHTGDGGKTSIEESKPDSHSKENN
jgi:transposase